MAKTATADNSKKGAPTIITGKKLAFAAKSKSARKKQRKSRREDYSTYVYKVLKQVHPAPEGERGLGFSKKGVAVMNSLVKDIFEKLSTQAAELARYNNRETLQPKDIQTAVRLLFPGELSSNAILEGQRALTKFETS